MALPVAATAQTAPQASFQVSAQISSGCLINNAVPDSGASLGEIGLIDFGNYSALATGTADAQMVPVGSITLTCTPGLELAVLLDGGLHAADGQRHMKNTTHNALVGYSLFRDSARQYAIAINQNITVVSVSDAPITLPIFARATLPGHLPGGNYHDTLGITLEW